MIRRSYLFGVVATILALQSSLFAWAQTPISNNPDDYNVGKYQQLFDQSVMRVRDARVLFSTIHHRIEQIENRLRQVQTQIEALQRDIEANNQIILNSEARINTLRQTIEGAQRELQQLQLDTPAAEIALMDERRRYDSFQSHLNEAENNANSLEAVARDKATLVRNLEQTANAKREALANIQRRMSEQWTRLQRVQSQREALARSVSENRARVQQTATQLEAAKATVTRLESETSDKFARSQTLDAEANSAESAALEAERLKAPDAPALRKHAVAARFQANAARAEYQKSDTALNSARTQYARIQAELDRLNTSLNESQSQLAALEAQINDANSQFDALKPQLADAQASYNQAQSGIAGARADAERAQAAAAQSRQTANDIRLGLNASENRMREIQARVDQLHQRKANLEQSIAGWTNEINTERQNKSAAHERRRALSNQLQVTQNQMAGIAAEMNQASLEREQALVVKRDAERENAFFGQRLNEVIQNLRNAIAIATADGASDGQGDGSNEGTRQGTVRGGFEGTQVGEREGTAQGMREGVERARATGHSQGETVGRTEGTERGAADGRSRGQIDGQSQGRAKGLQDGYEAGRAEGDAAGYAEGQTQGHNMGGVEKGRREGYATGRSRAESEGNARGREMGNRKGLEEFYNFNLADQTFRNHDAVGRQESASFDRPNWENFNPRRTYVHPDIQSAYNASYQQSFYNAAAGAYDATYAVAYQRTHDQAFERTRADFASRSYPEERRAAFDASRSSAYEATFRQTSDAAYREVFQPTFDQAYQTALPERNAEGRGDGRRQGLERGKSEAYAGDLAQGRAAGEQAGFDENITRITEAASKAAYDAVVAHFSNNAVLRFDGVVTLDANQDGINAPGEQISLGIAVKNFGKVSQTRDVTVVLSNPSAGLILDSSTDTLRPLPGQTRTVVTGVTSFRISPDAELGRTETLTVTINSGTEVLGTSTMSLSVGYPYVMTAVDHSEYPTAGADNALNVSVRNASSKASNNDVTVRLVSLDSLAEITRGSVNLGRLAPGQIASAPLAFTFTEANANKVLSFELQVLEGNWILGKRRFTVNSAKRWQYSSDAVGLIVVSSGDTAKRAEDSARASGLKYDIYDVRVEGQLSSETATRYSDKAIIVPSVTAELTEVTATTLRAYLDARGAVLAGMSAGSDRTPVGGALDGVVTRTSALTLGHMKVYQPNKFRAETRGVVVLTTDLRLQNASGTAADLAEFDLFHHSFNEKVSAYLAASAAGSAVLIERTREVLLFDLVKEMRDNADLRANNFKTSRASLTLTAFVNKALSSVGVERRTILMLYPAINQARTSYERDGWFRSTPIADVLKPLKVAYEIEILHQGRRGD